MCYTSTQFMLLLKVFKDLLITDVGRSKNIQKNIKFGRKIRIQFGPI